MEKHRTEVTEVSKIEEQNSNVSANCASQKQRGQLLTYDILTGKREAPLKILPEKRPGM